MSEEWTFLGATPWLDFGKCGAGRQEGWQRRIGAVVYEVSAGVFGTQVGYRWPLGVFVSIPHETGCSVERGMQTCEDWAAILAGLPMIERDRILWGGTRSKERRAFEDTFRRRGVHA